MLPLRTLRNLKTLEMSIPIQGELPLSWGGLRNLTRLDLCSSLPFYLFPPSTLLAMTNLLELSVSTGGANYRLLHLAKKCSESLPGLTRLNYHARLGKIPGLNTDILKHEEVLQEQCQKVEGLYPSLKVTAACSQRYFGSTF